MIESIGVATHMPSNANATTAVWHCHPTPTAAFTHHTTAAYVLNHGSQAFTGHDSNTAQMCQTTQHGCRLQRLTTELLLKLAFRHKLLQPTQFTQQAKSFWQQTNCLGHN
jgi:hypothetical protein